jgi:hypothetical protein
MKLSITSAQLRELSPTAAAALEEWAWKGHMLGPSGQLPRLTIGQMIAVLVDHQPEEEKHSYIDESNYDVVLCTQTNYYRATNRFDLGWKGELCDALWDRVKEVLEAHHAPL